MSNKIPKISNTFTNIKGEIFTNVREIAYKTGELCGNLGKFITETQYGPSLFFEDDLEMGVYIYQTYTNPNVAYRIYKTFAEYKFNGYDDDILIQKLIERSKDISLTNFPTGVVTLEGRIIGQEVPFYPNSKVIPAIDINKLTDNNPVIIYKKILNALKELSDNGIAYLDIHDKNFMVDISSNSKVNIIDFDLNYMKFDEESKLRIQEQLYNYRRMIDALNKRFNIIDITGTTEPIYTFDEAYELLDDMNKKIYMKK